jgi:hypothetical protein
MMGYKQSEILKGYIEQLQAEAFEEGFKVAREQGQKHGHWIDGDKLFSKIAGHSDYHGDSILSAIACMMEGKEIGDVPYIADNYKIVRHGHWRKDENGETVCSRCDYPAEFNPISSDFIESNYCANCGAKMDEEVKNDRNR